MKLNSKFIQFSKENLRKWLPALLLLVLTVVLMISFKNKRLNLGSLLEEGKTNLASFYTQNMKPLFFRTEITNSDVFDFALRKNIYLDKEQKKVLKLETAPSGEEFFTLQNSNSLETKSYYLNFVSRLDLSQKEKEELDSILSSYKNDIYLSVLYNDKNTLAVDPNISILRQAIVLDIAKLVKNLKKKSIDQFLPFYHPLEDSPIIYTAVDKIRKSEINNYIFFTPDTVFEYECEFNKSGYKADLETTKDDLRELRVKLKDLKIDIHTGKKEIQTRGDSLKRIVLKFSIDSNRSKVTIPKNFLINFKIPELDSLSEKMNSFSLDFRDSSDPKLKINFDAGQKTPDGKLTIDY